MFKVGKMNVFANNDKLKQYYSNEYPMYREELKREMDREARYSLQKGLL